MCLHHFRFPLFLLKVRSVRMLNTIVCSGPSVWQLLQDECLATFYPRRRIPAFVPYGLSVLTQMEHFVCFSCEKRGFPSFFVSKRAVHTHMSKSKMCKGGESKRITVMTRPGEVIAGGSGGMGPCLPSQHQPPGIYLVYTRYILCLSSEFEISAYSSLFTHRAYCSAL